MRPVGEKEIEKRAARQAMFAEHGGLAAMALPVINMGMKRRESKGVFF